ncbi:unnamed protein product (macronuclear) [Paramecium tetraurelia]|uniref:Large ribosomal subunit protein bL21m n=1 Tax=Paramecium tetraurelia TaxID=5888 RepID=A0DP78_PARTE|nr:uncharacterized protein GSPATT00019027001 [Paramecium tetraurelia]CAK84845.1 unnamed protein product [Paramecium tetraurelia]|eukprot:XP_001452242.1 hypothetical protein (macronuclear) [Paramecium tetraurelia strain d4-2]
MIKQLFRRSLITQPRLFTFSEYFKERDKAEIFEYYNNKFTDKRYIMYTQKWRNDLEKKAKRRARHQELERQRTLPVAQECKFIVHDQLKGIELPTSLKFAVCKIGNSQYKVVKDDQIITEFMEGLDINTTIELDQVLMVGAKDYTVLGRPFVENAKVLATVEQQTLSEKELIYKKKRRKRYQKSQGHRQKITILRINEVVHDVNDQLLNRAVALI